MKTKTDRIAAARTRHHDALATLYCGNKPVTGAQLWRQLRRVEMDASDAATAQCNGEPYHGQPYREEAEWDVFCAKIEGRVAKILGALPSGFRFNTDPRGYALKLDPERGAVIPAGLETDWGGYGLLAPVIE